MDIPPVFQTLGISLGLGLLVGMQRERKGADVAGVRTFPLITLTGTLSALLAESYGGWIVAAALLGVIAATVVGNIGKFSRDDDDFGITTEIAIIAMFLIGTYVVLGDRGVAVALGAGVAVLLYAKAAMHEFVERLGKKDVRAVMQFALITLVILPVLPNESFGPFDVLNLRNIWLMVVLVSGISFIGYVLYKLFGARAGVIAAGLLGGAISSTATTASYAQRVHHNGAGAMIAAVAILLASVVSIVRVFIEMVVVAPSFARTAALPLSALIGAGLLLALGAWFMSRSAAGDIREPDNPVELKPALIFAGLYAAVLLAVAAGKEWFGSTGLYVVAVLSGLTDLDAITLSTSRLVGSEESIEASTGWRIIIVAIVANLAFKAGLAGVIGGWRLLRLILIPFGALTLIGLGLVILL